MALVGRFALDFPGSHRYVPAVDSATILARTLGKSTWEAPIPVPQRAFPHGSSFPEAALSWA
jgi:hypothetical protein